MGKSTADVKELQRRLVLLEKIEARAVASADGPCLVWPEAVVDPWALVDACQAGLPSIAALSKGIRFAQPPVPITARFLAVAQRDLRALEAPELAALARSASRLFARYGPLDAAWRARKRERLARLAEDLRRPPEPAAEGETFARVLALVALLHGEAAALALDEARAALTRSGGDRRAEARARLESIVQRLEQGDGAAGGPNEEVVTRAALALAPLRAGRTRSRRALAILRSALGVPRASGHGDRDPLAHRLSAHEGSLVALVREAGVLLLGELPSTRGAAFRAQVHDLLAPLGLAFDPTPSRGRTLAEMLTPSDVEAPAFRRSGGVQEAFAGRALAAVDVVALAKLGLEGAKLEDLGALVAGGLHVEQIESVAKLGRLHLTEPVGLKGDPEGAAAYAAWVTLLLPHYQALGLSLPLTPAVTANLRTARREDMAVLAVCLMQHHATATPETVDRALATLDATLGLFRHSPARVRDVLAALGGTTAGAGRAALPDVADWLGDDTLLDSYVHLCRLAGVVPSLSQRLRRDVDRAARAARERAHLASLTSRTVLQERRLAKLVTELTELESEADDAPESRGAAWTRRRLRERLPQLLAKGYARQIDGVLRSLLRDAFGISVKVVTPAWRDAIRFYLGVDRNREHLEALLRFAAAHPGDDIAAARPKNRVWLAKAARHMRVDAWMAPRSREVVIQGKACLLAIERDAIEVLRMGIPFDTCLSLAGGYNAPSTVINALDANKRVVYLRDERGSILARKLLAISSTWKMIGYQLYVAVSGPAKSEVARAFASFCAELSADVAVPFGAAGVPEQIHDGFWYDDGTVPFEDEEGEEADHTVAAYLAPLGLAVPTVVADWLRWEASEWARRERADGPRGAAEVVRAAEAAGGAARAIDAAGRLADYGAITELRRVLTRAPRDPELAFALVAAGRASSRVARFDDHGIEHETIYALPKYAEQMRVPRVFDLCDQAARLWSYVAAQSSHCVACVATGEEQLLAAITRAYAGARAPEHVVACLQSRRRGTLARRAALRLAATYSLARDATAPTLSSPRVEPLALAPGGLRALERLRAFEPSLVDTPDMLAALLRQSGGDLRRIGRLPVPDVAPFEALGDLHLQIPELGSLLERWCDLDIAPPAWRPGAWELAHHRRHDTAWRRRLAALGLPRWVETLRGVDPAETAAALERITGAPDGSGLAPDYELLASAELDAPRALAILLRVLALRARSAASTELSPGERSFARAYLAKASHGSPEVTPELAVLLLPHAELRDDLVSALAHNTDRGWIDVYARIASLAAQASPALATDGFFDAWVGAYIEGLQFDAVGDIDDPVLLRRAIRAVVTSSPPVTCISLYQALGDAPGVAIFLDEIVRAGLPEAPAFMAAVEHPPKAWTDPRMAAQREWLARVVPLKPGA